MPTGYEDQSQEELWDSLNRFPRDVSGKARVELLGEFTIEEAVQMGAFFEDPEEQAAFDRAAEARGLRYPWAVPRGLTPPKQIERLASQLEERKQLHRKERA